MRIVLAFLLIVFLVGCSSTDPIKRNVDFNFDWQFHLGDVENGQAVDLDDSEWRTLNLPHDWSVEASFDSTLEGCTAYLPGGIGWYRKTFLAPPADQVTYIVFDGVYNNADIWLNGTHLGFHPFGYSPFYYDVTPHLKTDAENILAVRVDHSRYADSRWYTGSGIYRNVELVSVSKLHIPVWGTFVTTPEVDKNQAEIDIEIKIKNEFDENRYCELATEIINPAGKKVADISNEFEILAGEETVTNQQLVVKNPQLWDVENPNMYKAVTSVWVDGKIADQYETPFGIRTFRFDAENGFFLNGKNMLIKGVCLHHDGGLVGAAVPKGVWKRRLEKLKEGGCNSIRTAHNPPSKEFLELCDEIGFLVQDEFFDEMDNPKDKRLNMNERHDDYITRGYAEHFQEWAEIDLKTTMLRDRNHPCVFQWSIGNEIEWTYPRYKYATGYFDAQWSGNYFWTPPHIEPDEIKKRYNSIQPDQYVLAETAQKLSKWTKELDTTRPVTANCILPSASHVTGYADALDVVGYSYRRVVYDFGHKHFPDKPIMGTENLGQWHEWKAVVDRPFISGLFIWTGVDYLGEAHSQWPGKGSSCGLIDFAGFDKPQWHMYKTLWNDDPHIYIATQTADKSIYKVDEDGNVVEKKSGAWQNRLWSWHDVNAHWNYDDGETVIVEVYSNSDKVELFLNNKSLGEKQLTEFEDRIYRWAVPFEKGELKAVSKSAQEKIITATDPVGIQLEIDKKVLHNDFYDVAHITAQLIDENGNPVTHMERNIQFEMDGHIKALGVDNGAANSIQDYQTDKVKTSNGRALLIVQATDLKSDVIVTALADGLSHSSIQFAVK